MKQQLGMDTRHLPIDDVSLSFVRGELDSPEVRRKGKRSEEEERGNSSHGWSRGGEGRSRTDSPTGFIRIYIHT